MLRRSQSSPGLLQGLSRHPSQSHYPLRPASAQASAIQSPRRQRPATIAGTADIDSLIQHLQGPGALTTGLDLHLSTHANAKALARLLEVVDELAEQGTLMALRVTVEGSDRGPIDKALREALAGSRACLVLSGETVRPLIFRDLARLQDLQGLHGELLPGFLDMTLANQMERPLEVGVADRLISFALSTGEDALLRAAAVLSPHYQCHLMELPDPQVYERLVRQGVACSLNLQIDCASAQSIIDWLYLPHPTLQAIDLTMTQSLDEDTSMSLWTRLVTQPSMQRVGVNITSGVTIHWSSRAQAALAPIKRIDTLRIRLEDRWQEPPQIVDHLMEWFHPVHLILRSTLVPTGALMLDAIGDRAHHRPLRSLTLNCETGHGVGELSLSLALIALLKRFDRVQYVCVRMQHGLPSQATLNDLETAARQNFLLRSLELTQTSRHWVAEQYRFDKPLRPGLARCRFFQAYVVAGAKVFFQNLVGTFDPFRAELDALNDEPLNTLEQGLLSSGYLALAQISPETHQAAMEHRTELQASVVIDAMREGLLDPPTLRELLMSPSGQLDVDLVTAIFKRLCEAREIEGVWRLFDEATAFHRAD